MSATWKDNYLRFDLPYWVLREDENGAENRCGSIRFDIGCRKVVEGGERYSVKQIIDALEKTCKKLIGDLAKQNGLSFVEALDMVAHGMYNHCVDITTLETDEERGLRVVDQQKKNKAFFDKFSEET